MGNDPAPVVNAMSTLLGNVTLVVEEGVDWLTAAVGGVMASGNELLQMFVIIGLVGTGIGLMRRIIG